MQSTPPPSQHQPSAVEQTVAVSAAANMPPQPQASVMMTMPPGQQGMSNMPSHHNPHQPPLHVPQPAGPQAGGAAVPPSIHTTSQPLEPVPTQVDTANVQAQFAKQVADSLKRTDVKPVPSTEASTATQRVFCFHFLSDHSWRRENTSLNSG